MACVCDDDDLPLELLFPRRGFDTDDDDLPLAMLVSRRGVAVSTLRVTIKDDSPVNALNCDQCPVIDWLESALAMKMDNCLELAIEMELDKMDADVDV
jgi:hypothetical protein